MTLLEYIEGRRRTIEASVAAETLANNECKLACERTALAEITALEAFVACIEYRASKKEESRKVSKPGAEGDIKSPALLPAAALPSRSLSVSPPVADNCQQRLPETIKPCQDSMSCTENMCYRSQCINYVPTDKWA